MDSTIITAQSNFKTHRILSNTKKYIEVNRLTLGIFFSIEKVYKFLYKKKRLLEL